MSAKIGQNGIRKMITHSNHIKLLNSQSASRKHPKFWICLILSLLPRPELVIIFEPVSQTEA